LTHEVFFILLITGDQLLTVLSALDSPQRLRIIAALASGGRNYVSQLQKLQAAGLVTSQLEISDDGKALNYFETVPFQLELTPAAIARAAKSLTPNSEQ
jgi:DNA-binding transcriptional ArsR family regulator